MRKSLLVFRLLLVLMLCFSFGVIKASEKIEEDEALSIKLGERLFRGTISLGTDTKSCFKCHFNEVKDSINWNPSLYDISQRSLTMSLDEMKSTLLSPSGKVLEASHVGYKLTDVQVEQIRTYLKHEASHPRPHEKPTIYRLLVFLFLGLLMAVALVDLFFTKKIKYKALHLLVIIIGIGVQAQMLFQEGVKMGRSEGFAPDQPIKFSHKIHAGDNKIDCMYCHSGVEKGKSAGIPSANVCMNCHVIVREGSKSGQFEIKKIIAAMDSAKAIEWIRVHSLPDHVFFDHSQHVKVGNVACKECHGEVEKMDILTQKKDLSMGWCLDCHRTHNIKLGENGYYSHTFKDLMKRGKQSMTVAEMGGEDCMKCHY